jgi:phosphopantetheinyl transferase (holo-ACP synthase)
LEHAFANERDVWIQPAPRDLSLAVLWALKEAASKAVGLGLGIGLETVICEEVDSGRHRVALPCGAVLQGRHFEYDQYVIAVCVLP